MIKSLNIDYRSSIRALMMVMVAMSALVAFDAMAAKSAGDIAESVTDTFSNLAKMITGASYIAGLGFMIGAILKFKQHKDNPTQIPVGTPVALLFVAAALVFMPSVIGSAGQTVFGGEQSAAGSGGIDELPK